MRGLGTRHRVADVLPPQLSQLGVVRNVGAGGRPLNAGGRAVELDQTAQFRSTIGEGLVLDGGLADEGQADMRLLDVHSLGHHELRIKPSGLSAINRGRLHQGPRAGVLITHLHAILPIGAVGRGGHAPLGRAVLVHDGQTFLDHIGGEGGVPEHLLGDIALCRNRASFPKGHALGFWRGKPLQPVNRLGHSIDGGGVVGGTATRNARADRLRVFIDADTPFVDRKAVGFTHVAHTGHRHPRVGVAPAKRGILLAVVHVAKDAGFRATCIRHVAAGEEFGDVFIGRPVQRDAKIIAILGFEVVLGLLMIEPVGAEPIQVGELLGGKLIQLAIRRGGELGPDKVGHVEVRVGDRRPFARHPVIKDADLLIAPVGADQVAVVDVGVIDVLARLHLRLQLFHHIAFADEVMGHLDAGDRLKGRGQNLGLVFMGRDGFRYDLDFHAGIGLGCVDEPLHLGFLIGARQGRKLADFRIKEGLCGLHIGPGRGRAKGDQRKRHRGCRLSQSHCIPPRMNEVRSFVFAKGAGKIRPPRRFHAFHHTQRNTAAA